MWYTLLYARSFTLSVVLSSLSMLLYHYARHAKSNSEQLFQVHQGQFTGLGAISPKVLVQNLRMIGRQFRQGRQVRLFVGNHNRLLVRACLSRLGCGGHGLVGLVVVLVVATENHNHMLVRAWFSRLGCCSCGCHGEPQSLVGSGIENHNHMLVRA